MHMATTNHWTLDELHRLPDDGNRYELLRGELLVTPPPSVAHEELASVLARLLHAYVSANGVGRVYGPRSVLRSGDSEVEPDLIVRPIAPVSVDWPELPVPVLVVEILSDATRRRDAGDKRAFYLGASVAEYWMVDGTRREIRVVRARRVDEIIRDTLRWAPAVAAEALVLDVAALFREALG